MNWIKALSAVVILSACHPDRNKAISYDEIRFGTTDASEIYFKNVRKSVYREESLPDAGLNIYRNPKLENDPIWLEPIIVVNWRTDQAFILIEADTIDDPLSFHISGDNPKLLTFDKSNHQKQAQFCIGIYNAILSGDSISYNQETFLGKTEHREIFRKMVFDWLRLVEIR